MEKNGNWKVWDRKYIDGAMYYKRATGELEEMESSKALCGLLSKIYRPKMKILDVGCGAGHYLRSFRKRLDENIDYTGIDATKSHIEYAKKAFGSEVNFSQGDIFNLQFENNSFDIVVCNNVLLHLPPPPVKPISELIRVSKKHIIIRLLTASRTYITKGLPRLGETEGIPAKEKDMIKADGEIPAFTYFNRYSEQYLKEIIEDMGTVNDFKIEPDNSWNAFNNELHGGEGATQVFDGKQISGGIVLNWSFITLSKKISAERK